jgi:hypothetical protein
LLYADTITLIFIVHQGFVKPILSVKGVIERPRSVGLRQLKSDFPNSILKIGTEEKKMNN